MFRSLFLVGLWFLSCECRKQPKMVARLTGVAFGKRWTSDGQLLLFQIKAFYKRTIRWKFWLASAAAFLDLSSPFPVLCFCGCVCVCVCVRALVVQQGTSRSREDAHAVGHVAACCFCRSGPRAGAWLRAECRRTESGTRIAPCFRTTVRDE